MILPRSFPIMAEKKTRQRTEVVERGNIWFIYRPKVRAEDEPEQDVGGIGDVERFHVVLRPDGAARFRLMTIGAKRLPDADEHERNWGFVDLIAKSAGQMTDALGEEHYEHEDQRRACTSRSPARRRRGVRADADGQQDASGVRAGASR